MPTVYAAGGVATSAWLLLALPAFGALVLLVGGRRTDGWGHLLGCVTVVAAFVWGLVMVLGLGLCLPAPAPAQKKKGGFFDNNEVQHKNTPKFLEAFRRKGRFATLLDRVPVHVVLNSKVGLMGAASLGLAARSDG